MPIPTPYPEQREVILSPHRFNVVAGTRSYGKSAVIAPLWLAAQVTGKGVRDREAWVAAQTFGGVRDLYWDTLKELFEPALAEKPRESDLTLRLINGSRVQLVGMDRLPSRRGKRLNAFVGDEFAFLKNGTWQVIRPMLTKGGEQGRALLLSSANGQNEFYDLLQKGLPSDEGREPGWWSWIFDYTVARHITADEIADARRDMDPDAFEQEYGVKFLKRSGAVYAVFDRTTHVKPTPIDPRLPVLIGEDFNIDCQVSVLCQVEPAGRRSDERLRVFGEVVSRGVWTQDHAAKVADVLRAKGMEPRQARVYCDASGNARSRTSISDVEAVRSQGFQVYHPTANPHPEDRHNAVRALLKSADGTVRMQIDPSCRLLIDSLERLSYRAGTNPPDVDKTKGYDHACDALGYLVHYRWAPGSTVRPLRRR